ncbi:MAG: DUF5686 family protein [Bacteroides sp.]|nr:DUF5686 family protein [Bacteroides sp.]
MRHILTIRLIILCLLFPLAGFAKREKVSIPDKPAVSNSILQCIFQFSPFYSRIIDEYKADLYIKGKLKVYKRNHLIRYVPSMFRFEKHIKDYMMESLSELHYTAPDIYDRKIKAVSGTFPRNRGQITDVMDYLNMNVYSSSLMSDKLPSPLDKRSSKYYTYLLDSVAGSSDCQRYKILIIPKFRGTQLVSGYMWVSDQIWTIRELYIEGVYDVIRFKVHVRMGEEGDVEFLPVQFDLNLVFKFLGNHLEMDYNAWLKYNEIRFYEGATRRKFQKKHHHDLTDSYSLTCDSALLITDKEKFKELRPLPLTEAEDSLYKGYAMRHDTLLNVPKKKKNERLEFWGELGDMLISSYNVNLSTLGSVHCSPLINPVLFDYSHSRGFSYKQRFKYSRLFHSGRILRISPQIGYNFTHKELYVKADADWQYWPEKQGSFEVSVGNGNRIYSSVVLDQLKQLPDSTFNFDNVELDYFKDVYLNLFHNIEVVNGLYIKAGVSVHWRYLINNSKLVLEKLLPDKDWAALRGIKSSYNSFAPRIRIEWTPGMYYYMNGGRKMNVGSKMPTFMLDYERGIKGVFGSTGAHERWEFDIQQNLKLSGIRSIGYRIGGGVFTKQDDMYFVDFANFARRNIPEGWNDDIGGTFQLLDGRWYNSSRQYWRGNFTYESPFILLKPLNRWLGMIQQERLYGGILFMPHLNPYIELGYGIGTHIFDVGAFVSTINGQFDTVGFKFTFELFNK